MRRWIVRTCCGLLAVLNLALNAAEAEVMKQEESKAKNQWVNEHLLDVKAKVPFSFVYDGRASETVLAEWPRNVESKKLDAARTQHTLVWTDPNSGLEVRCVAVDYADYPAVEWLLHFTNTGKGDSPIMERIQALDCILPAGGEGFVLHRAAGDTNSAGSFAPVDEPISPKDLRGRAFAPRGGRSSD
ncbi:MAG: hypothetical protein NTU94_04885, partial [Planctomycetota bacterium]|nr:hypothetical protein [Planctomycetota bacterium]